MVKTLRGLGLMEGRPCGAGSRVPRYAACSWDGRRAWTS